MKLSFRPIKQKDFEFLWRLHNAALKDYVTQTWGWDEDWQKRNFTKTFKPEKAQIIVFEEKDVGYWEVSEKETETVLISIRLLPAYQKRGIGTKLIKDLLDNSQKSVRLQVLKVNPARKLYARLGFEIFDETDTHFLMRRFFDSRKNAQKPQKTI